MIFFFTFFVICPDEKKYGPPSMKEKGSIQKPERAGREV
jgi:hypothetical protein